MEKIYIQLLEEGTTVYRPVSALKIKQNIYQVKGHDIYDPNNEKWEFTPDMLVIVESRNLEGERVLIAIKEVAQS